MTPQYATFKYKKSVPRGGKWFYLEPKTKAMFESRQSLADLTKKVAKYLRLNKLEVPENLAQIIEDYMCRHLPPGFCNEDVSEVRVITFSQAVRFTELLFKTLWARIKHRNIYVDPVEALRRAQICAGCDKNISIGCYGCHGIRQLAASMIADRSTPLDSYLGVCAICGCLLAAKIHVKLEYLRAIEKDLDKFPETCWIKQDESGV